MQLMIRCKNNHLKRLSAISVLFAYKHLFHEVCLNRCTDKMSTIPITKQTNMLATKAGLPATKSEIITCMFIFWSVQVVATFGFILLYLNK